MKDAYRFLVLSAACLLPLSAAAQTYTYDSLGRVSTVVQPNGAKTVYYYDGADNRTVTQTATNGTTTATPPTNSPVIWVTQPSNLFSLAQSIGFNVTSPGSYTFIVPAGATLIGGSNSPGIDTGSWPAGTTIALVINGTVGGGGGPGGTGACYNTTTNTVIPATAGTAGGDAVSVHYPVTITVNSSGVLSGGGGGGGGGGVYGQSNGHGGSGGACGGGGGGGYPNGAGGLAYSPAPSGFSQAGNGASGTLSGGGAGGSGIPGGAGGGQGAAGAAGVTQSFPGGAGGGAGYAVRKNGYTAPVTSTGTVNGTVG